MSPEMEGLVLLVFLFAVSLFIQKLHVIPYSFLEEPSLDFKYCFVIAAHGSADAFSQ